MPAAEHFTMQNRYLIYMPVFGWGSRDHPYGLIALSRGLAGFCGDSLVCRHDLGRCSRRLGGRRRSFSSMSADHLGTD
jgi:hypothetical protein